MTPTRQGNIRVGRKGAAASAQWINPECQWQGASTKDCDETMHVVPVWVPWPIRTQIDVHVCSAHYEAYVRAAGAAGVLA